MKEALKGMVNLELVFFFFFFPLTGLSYSQDGAGESAFLFFDCRQNLTFIILSASLIYFRGLNQTI